ncbi:flavonol synthase 1-like [Argentina anserina]|uniref:flavonol synthase 1-like n=1 Tax=Argentina anserina TaxID=57926 RepID=UPI00217653E0|nr:flavonol synthase 1-like [Potentilla anserina]
MQVERVQALASGGLNELPEKFIRPFHEQPVNSNATEGVAVPVISLAKSHIDLVKEVAKAAEEWGFFLITDHGIPASLIEELQKVGKEFFMLSQEEKEVYANDPASGKFEGYGTKMTKNHDEKLEWIDYLFHFTAPPSKVNQDIWPKNLPSYREVNQEYNKEMLRVTGKLLEVLSEGLGLDRNALKSHIGDEEVEVEMKINMYPPCPQPQLALGVESHTDMSAITLLVSNDVPGLQLWKDDNWVAVNYLSNAVVINIGDQIEVLSNGKYKSVLHRSLVNKERFRISWAVFVAPPQEAVIGPLPELVDEQNPAKYSTKTYGKYRFCKINKIPQLGFTN